MPVRHAVSALVRGPATPVQERCLPPVIGGADLLAVAPTGSGKTLVAAVALALRVAGSPSVPGHPRGLVLAPTRELAEQVAEVTAPIAAAAGVRVETFVGGGPTSAHRRSAAMRVDVAVATPGRLLELVRARILHLDAVREMVLDEADHLLDRSFVEQVTSILDACRDPRLLALTATAAPELLAALRARRPALEEIRIAPSASEERPSDAGSDGPVAGPPRSLVLLIDPDPEAVAASLARRCRRALMFTARRDDVARLRAAVEAHGVPAAGVEGGASPTRRTEAYGRLATGEVRVLVTTDLSARGLDVPEVGHVVHVGPPQSTEDLVHRSGRTGRGDAAAGVVVAVVRPAEEWRMLGLAERAGFAVRTLRSPTGAEADRALGPEIVEPARRRRPPAPTAASRRPAPSRRHRPKRTKGGRR